MALVSNWITSKAGLALCGLAFAGYQLNQVVEVDGWQQLSVSLRQHVGETVDGGPYGTAEMGAILPGSGGGLISTPLLPASYTASSLGGVAASDHRSVASSIWGSGGQAGGGGPTGGGDSAGGKANAVSNLRIATWALDGFGPEQLRDRELASIFQSSMQPFDVIAVQQIRVSERDFLPQLVSLLNQRGRAYDYLVAPPSASGGSELQSVFLFDTRRVVTDRTQVYTIADPDNRLLTKPSVAWFRAAEVSPQRAWTFSLVNVCIDLAQARQEVYELPRLLATVAADGRGEDDVIVAGLLQADRTYLQGTLAGKPRWFAAGDQLTDVHGQYQTSNLFIDAQVTSEAVLRGGVLDFLRLNNLSVAQAERISQHLPVYAEFCPWEGGSQP